MNIFKLSVHRLILGLYCATALLSFTIIFYSHTRIKELEFLANTHNGYDSTSINESRFKNMPVSSTGKIWFTSIRFDSEHALSSYLVLSCLVSTSCGDELLYIPSILNIVYCTRTTLHILIHFCYYSLSFIHSFRTRKRTRIPYIRAGANDCWW